MRPDEIHELDSVVPDGVWSTSGRRATVSVGDAFDVLGKIEDGSVDCVVTSPPYWGLRSYGHSKAVGLLETWSAHHPTLSADELRLHPPGYEWYRDNGGELGLEPFPDWYVGHLVEIFNRVRPKLAETGSIWVNLGDTYFARWSSIRHDGRQGLGSDERDRRRTPAIGYLKDKQLLQVPARFAIAMQDRRWILRNDLIWSKPSVPPRPEKDRLRLAHEHFFHFAPLPKRGRAAYYYDLAGAEEGARDVVTVRAKAGRDGHSATFPLELIRPRIVTSCPPGGTVLDPFCGTGSTLEAAILAGRRAVGIELSPTFARSARRNVARARRTMFAQEPVDER